MPDAPHFERFAALAGDIEALANNLPALPVIGDAECVQIATAEWFRDQIRLLAYQIPDPETPPTPLHP